jgi:hypothetical protein
MSDIALVSDKVPAHATKGSGLGNENITAAHLQTPRVKQLQQLSNEVDENHSEYITGSKPGDFINTITREKLRSGDLRNKRTLYRRVCSLEKT